MLQRLKENKYIHPILAKYHHVKIVALILLIIILISFSFQHYTSHSSSHSKKTHYVFTFWEPARAMPGYIRLCIKTWAKNLPSDYEIVLLDYSNIARYIGLDLVSKIICKDMSLPTQADAVRVAVLSRYGGIWMDADTVLMNSSFFDLFAGHELAIFGNPRRHQHNVGFIYASQKSRIIQAWLSTIIYNVKVYRFFGLLSKIFPIPYVQMQWKRVHSWNYLGNGIFDRLSLSASEKEYLCIDRASMFAFPEHTLMMGSSEEQYQHFYFQNGTLDEVYSKCRGILLLHNSWTPREYKSMSEKEFLKQDIRLARIIGDILRR